MVSETGAVLHLIGDSDETIFSNSRMIVGGVRDYRYVSFPFLSFTIPFIQQHFFFFYNSTTHFSATWIRDSSFTLYALIRLGFTEEANSMFFSLFFSFLFWDLYVCTFLLNIYNRFPRVHI